MPKPKKGATESSDRETWNKVFILLAETLKSQHTQLAFFKDQIKLHHDRWVYDVNELQEKLFQMEKEFTIQEMEHMVEVAKAEYVVGSMHREAFVFQRKYEDADSLLADFRQWFDYLSHKCSEPNDILRGGTNEKAETSQQAQGEDELRRLRTENERLTLEKNNEISAILSEKNFIWNQYNILKDDTSEQLKKNRDEIAHANEQIEALKRNIEELKSSNMDKDNTIAMLTTQMANLESEKSGEIINSQGQRSRKRTAGYESKPSVPKLFTSAFKVPKSCGLGRHQNNSGRIQGRVSRC